MREILFRGKRIDNEEWIEGLLTVLWSQYHIVNPHDENVAYPIYTETVGQYTGLTDKDGKKIFEGDIVKCLDIYNDIKFIAIVEFGNPNGTYNWGWQFRIICGDKDANPDILLWVDMGETGIICEVIGNIHDNKIL